MPPPPLSTTTNVASIAAVGRAEQAVAVVQEAQVADQRDGRAPSSTAAAMPSTVDTKPSMPLTPAVGVER